MYHLVNPNPKFELIYCCHSMVTAHENCMPFKDYEEGSFSKVIILVSTASPIFLNSPAKFHGKK